MNEQNQRPLVLEGNQTVSLELPAMEQTGNETVMLSDTNETVMLSDANETVMLYEGQNAVQSNGAVSSVPGQKLKRELYQLPEGAVLQNRYVIGDILGFGGFGITYGAWDKTLDIKVAIKEYYPSNLVNRIPGEKQVSVYSAKQEAEYRKGLNRFLGEARNMAQFAHQDNIVSVFNFFEENGTAYLVMELLEGYSLKDYTKLHGDKLPAQEVIHITKCIINGLRTLHKQHIIHRDISPDNIYICNNGDIKLIDFGAARFAAESDEQKTLSVVLKPGFAPQEQYRSRGKQGPWTDIYALGATMYRTVTGIVPEESVNRTPVADGLVEPKQYVKDMPEYLNRILLRCLAISPELRFQNVDDLERALDRKKSVASVRGEIRRRRFFKALIACAVIAAALFGGVREYQYIQGIRNKANLEECTVTVWVPVETGADEQETRQAFEDSLEGFRQTYPAVTIDVEYIPRKEYASRIEEAGENQLPAVYEADVYAKQLPAADLEDAYQLLKEDDYIFHDVKNGQNSKMKLATGFNLPILYSNTLLKGNRDKVAGSNDLSSFLQGESAYYVGTYEDYAAIQKTLAGVYEISPVEKGEKRISYTGSWCVSSAAQEKVINAAERILYYLVSGQAEDVWYIRNENGLPLYKPVLATFAQVNPELAFIETIDYTDYVEGSLTEDYLEELYQANVK